MDLLKAVHPDGGWIAIVGIKNGRVKQTLVETREEADTLITAHNKRGADVYFGVAKYTTGNDRTKSNVQALKSLWVDIDCGETKAIINEKTGKPEGYLDKTSGLNALQGFCKLVGLPKPLLVDSGRGIHAYWILKHAVTREVWEPLATRFRELCLLHDFYVDPAVFEAARILRVPETLNHKDTPPTEVKILDTRVSSDISIETMSTLLGVIEKPKALIKRELSPLMQSMQDNSVSSFSKIMVRSAREDGCKQLLDCYQNQDTLPEPRWFNALSIAKFCKDKTKALHGMSEKHPDYDPTTTENKIAHIVGPHTCSKFEMNNPGGCTGCPHEGKIKSPIVLGKEFLAATEEDNEVEVKDEAGKVETHTIPTCPFPYYRGKNGGIYLTTKDEEVDDILIYAHDLYVVKIMVDPNAGDVVIMKLHLPMEGVRDFILPLAFIAEKRELKSMLARNGVATSDKKFTHLFDFIIKSIQELQYKYKAEKMRLQFGWADRHSKFIIGDREITADGTFHSPPSSATKDLAQHMQPTGTLEKWQEVFSLYDREGLEPQAFGALTAFGSPLLYIFGQSGALINLIHSKSGTGKTTVLHMCNSVYGNPKRLCSNFNDSIVSIIHNLGVMNNLPFSLDEITSFKPETISMLTYSMTQGRGRNRMKASSNELRVNATTWNSITLSSANASSSEKLGQLKNNPEGELMRLIEYRVENHGEIDTELAKEMFDHQLIENYGYAGDIFLQHIVNNLESVVIQALNMQKKIDRELELTQRERFWSAVIAANITGGTIAKSLGLIDWDMKRIYHWVLPMLNEMRQDFTPPTTNIMSVVGDYIHRYIQNILAVNDAGDRRSGLKVVPILEPRGELLIRYEPDTKLTFLLVKHFRAYCVEQQINYKETIQELKSKGILIVSGNKRLSKGMKIAVPAVHCLTLDSSGTDFIDMDAIVGVVQEEGEGEGEKGSE